MLVLGQAPNPSLSCCNCMSPILSCCSVCEALAAELVRPLGCASCTLDAEAVAVLNDHFLEGV